LKGLNRLNKGVDSRGFTLVELLVSIAVGAMLVTAIYATFFSVFSAGEGAKAGLGHRIEAARVLDRFSRDINSAYLSPANSPANSPTRFLGELVGIGPVLTLTTFTYPLPAASSPSSDLIGVYYFAEEAPDGLTLFKEIWNPYINDRFRVNLIDGIEAFEISYFNGKVWSKAWDSALEGALPKAVKLALTLKGGILLSATPRTMIR
jgi:general secretion pathway protein J